jgi:cyclomaltodextrinase / maltogenic alpha-amylase / neopullulanase
MKTLGLIPIIGLASLTGRGANTPTNLPADAIPWARDAIWYQIFPERFRNGDPANDPTRPELELPHDWRLSPWTNDWYQLQPEEQRGRSSFYSQVGNRRYGGDLQGVIAKLDYLSSLGANTLYLNPIFEAHSSHKYDAAALHHVDNNFGPDAPGDRALIRGEDFTAATWPWSAADRLLLELVQQAHRRHLRVVLDGVFNHVGTRFGPFQDVIKHQQDSKYAGWFKIRHWDDPATPQNEFDYQGWWGHKSLPEFQQDTNGLVAGPRDYIFNVTRRWMDPNGDGDPGDGIDGWRLDVANQIAHPFWRQWRKLVKSLNPGAIIVGELWEDAGPWLQGDEFDSVMNYRFAKAAVRFFIDTGTNRWSASQFDRELATIRGSYPEPVNYALLNLYDSHDTDRIASMIKNPNRPYDQQGGYPGNPHYDITKPAARDRSTQKLMALFQATYLGAPMIYYGTEAGMWGADDPDDRKPMVWADLKYEPERTDPLGRPRAADAVEFDAGLFAGYQRLFQLRQQEAALRRGSYRTLITADHQEVYAFERALANESIIVVLNNSGARQSVSVAAAGTWRDLLAGATVRSQANHISVKLEPKAGAILKRQAP